MIELIFGDISSATFSLGMSSVAGPGRHSLCGCWDLSTGKRFKRYQSDENHFRTALVYSRDNFAFTFQTGLSAGLGTL